MGAPPGSGCTAIQRGTTPRRQSRDCEPNACTDQAVQTSNVVLRATEDTASMRRREDRTTEEGPPRRDSAADSCTSETLAAVDWLRLRTLEPPPRRSE